MTTTNQKLSSLPSASRRGSYRFLGWYLADGAEITTDTVFSANTTVYATGRIPEVPAPCLPAIPLPSGTPETVM
mgnify:CR=1 FL=1